jgi:hypothetical protein
MDYDCLADHSTIMIPLIAASCPGRSTDILVCVQRVWNNEINEIMRLH